MDPRLPMCDLHCHTFLSDGELSPAELFARAEAAGIGALAVTDHVEWSTVETTVPALVAACQAERAGGRLLALPGAELTHVRPAQIARLAQRCRELGAMIVIVHGQTIVEPVPAGTNRAAIEAGVDVLAHPGLITEEEVRMAASAGVRLEVSGRQGHSLTNGHVVSLARAAGAELTFGSDTHGCGDPRGLEMALAILRGAGLDEASARKTIDNGRRLLESRAARQERMG
ncbi:MAG TPA: histidinol phosphate phosphatase domain-containing protein [Planctomycetota bacterium]|nr:histidinol phosphate phosphatase domain-containing protein [Planctomycetota bacterium]